LDEVKFLGAPPATGMAKMSLLVLQASRSAALCDA
jgi:hypothetical protein